MQSQEPFKILFFAGSQMHLFRVESKIRNLVESQIQFPPDKVNKLAASHIQESLVVSQIVCVAGLQIHYPSAY
jgi:hypothetical protein